MNVISEASDLIDQFELKRLQFNQDTQDRAREIISYMEQARTYEGLERCSRLFIKEFKARIEKLNRKGTVAKKKIDDSSECPF
jgi:hypothetical protein